MDLNTLSRSTWQFTGLFATLLSGISGGMLFWLIDNGNTLTGIVGGFTTSIFALIMMLVLGSINLGFYHIRSMIQDEGDKIRETVNIRPLISGPPLNYDDWAMNPYLGRVLSQEISRHKPTRIVECGSGTSTVFMTKLALKETPSARVTALEHLSEYAHKSRRLVKDHSLEKVVNIVTSPLKDFKVDGMNLQWYDVDLDRFEEESIDLLFVDGPPKDTGQLARYPALFVLKPYLSEQCVIVMDDGDRPEEKQTAQRWSDLLDGNLEYHGGPKGTYVIESF